MDKLTETIGNRKVEKIRQIDSRTNMNNNDDQRFNLPAWRIMMLDEIITSSGSPPLSSFFTHLASVFLLSSTLYALLSLLSPPFFLPSILSSPLFSFHFPLPFLLSTFPVSSLPSPVSALPFSSPSCFFNFFH